MWSTECKSIDEKFNHTCRSLRYITVSILFWHTQVLAEIPAIHLTLCYHWRQPIHPLIKFACSPEGLSLKWMGNRCSDQCRSRIVECTIYHNSHCDKSKCHQWLANLSWYWNHRVKVVFANIDTVVLYRSPISRSKCMWMHLLSRMWHMTFEIYPAII